MLALKVYSQTRGFALAQDSRFELVRRGYDPSGVDRELRSLNLEINRLQELNLELTGRVEQLSAQLGTAEQELSLRTQPSYSALGTKAATILATAEEQAAELTEQAERQARELSSRTEDELQQRLLMAEQQYQELLTSSERRSARRISEAELEAKQIVAHAESRAKQVLLEVEAEVARLRGQAATEVASMRVGANREIELRRAELEAELASRAMLSTDDVESAAKERVLKELEAQISLRRKDAELEYSQKHQEAVRQTQSYLESAQKDILDLKLAARTVRLEVETLELEATKTQTRMLQAARDQAEALVHAAELEALDISEKAQQEAKSLVRNAKAELSNLENAVLSSKTYLKNLRSVVAELEKLED